MLALFCTTAAQHSSLSDWNHDDDGLHIVWASDCGQVAVIVFVRVRALVCTGVRTATSFLERGFQKRSML